MLKQILAQIPNQTVCGVALIEIDLLRITVMRHNVLVIAQKRDINLIAKLHKLESIRFILCYRHIQIVFDRTDNLFRHYIFLKYWTANSTTHQSTY